MEEWVETTPLIRTSNQANDLFQNTQWDPAVTTTAAGYDHFANSTITTCSTPTVGYAYTASSLGLTDPT